MADGELWTSDDGAVWISWFDRVEDVVNVVWEAKKKQKTKRDLMADHRFLFGDGGLDKSIAGRKQPHVTLPELRRIMRWKLARGKFRPSLMGLIEKNEDVEAVTRTAFAKISRRPVSRSSVMVAMGALCKLKGVGPATASLILSLFNGDVPFMADEAMKAAFGPLRAIRYTTHEFEDFYDLIRGKLDQISEGERKLTAADLSHALWAFHTSAAMRMSQVVSGAKRKRTDKDVDEDCVSPKAKQRRVSSE
mmetsp:Transcript_5976/g.16882  ORF Transcript_5976/g.16882 Transcript_5976/m.16882 type:complete len:249 (-) Transcript_5976:229-975(-)